MPAAPEPLTARFPYRLPVGPPARFGDVAFAPLLPISLGSSADGREPILAEGLLDTGASVNVLPFELGLALGENWPERSPSRLRLGGNLSNHAAHPVLLTVTVANFAPVQLAFAWTRAERVPLILGQTNFFFEFDVCFFRSRKLFEVRPKPVPS